MERKKSDIIQKLIDKDGIDNYPTIQDIFIDNSFSESELYCILDNIKSGAISSWRAGFIFRGILRYQSLSPGKLLEDLLDEFKSSVHEADSLNNSESLLAMNFNYTKSREYILKSLKDFEFRLTSTGIYGWIDTRIWQGTIHNYGYLDLRLIIDTRKKSGCNIGRLQKYVYVPYESIVNAYIDPSERMVKLFYKDGYRIVISDSRLLWRSLY